MSRRGLTKVRRAAGNDHFAMADDEWFVPELAREIGVRPQAIYPWIGSGKLPARQRDGSQGRWIVRADPSMVESLEIAIAARLSKTTTSSKAKIPDVEGAHRPRVTRGVV